MSGTISTRQPSLGLTQYVARSGVFPPAGDGTGLDGSPQNSYVGLVHTFAGDFAPGGASQASGQELAIAQNTTLFQLLGTTYGGNGISTFRLPNLDGRLAVSAGTGTGLSPHFQGEGYGTDTVLLDQANLPASSGGTSAPIPDTGPTLPIRYFVSVVGVFPSLSGASVNGIGHVFASASNRVPAGLAEADGRLLSISENFALFSLIGTTFGGDGETTFALPDLRGRTIIGASPTIPFGTVLGGETDAITQSNMPVSMGGGGVPISNQQPSIALNFLIATEGVFPTQDGSGENPSDNPYFGQVIATLYDFVPDGWALANGATLPIAQNNALFAVLGTAFGSTGPTTFALPDLRGRSIIGTGTNTADPVALGQTRGTTDYTITIDQIPALTIAGTAASESFFGGDQGDTIGGAAGNDRLVGNGGNDSLDAAVGDDTAEGGIGIDTATYAAAAQAVLVALLLQGGAQNTLGAGTDLLSGIENLTGSNFNDTLGGDAAANLLMGGTGNDQLFGDGGIDTLMGGVGNDTLYGGAGNDSLAGGTGDDVYQVTEIGDLVVENAGEGTDSVYVAIANWVVSANIEAVYLVNAVVSLTGGANNDVLVANQSGTASTLSGMGGDDVLWGLGGDDTLLGGAGNDVLRGQGGGDVLAGGAGNDQLVGGAGADRFVFDLPGWGYDQIFDFTAGTDRLDMRGSGAADFAALVIYGAGGSTVVTLGAARIDVYGAASLSAADFIFS